MGAAPNAAGCGRSDESYPVLLAADLGVTAFELVACGGAVTADVTGAQLAAVNRRTDLLTVTVGGNDIGFGTGISTCLQGTDADCQAVVAEAQRVTVTELPAKLDNLYSALRRRAPHAQLLVGGYPYLFEETADCAGTPLSLPKRTALNDAVDTLDQVTADRARAAGATYVEPRALFAGHGACAAQPWMNGLVPNGGSFHPNAGGYASGYTPAFRAAVCPARSGE